MGLGERREAAAVDRLLKLLGPADGYVGRHIGDALSKIGEPAVPALIRALQDERPAVRVQAARALVRIESQQAIPALIEALDDPEAAVEHYVWEALQRMGVGTMCYFKP
jgi:HEAT repeat protein